MSCFEIGSSNLGLMANTNFLEGEEGVVVKGEVV